MESQRVKTLTEGYLRGWLDFKYPLKTSHLREALVCKYIEENNLYALLEHRLFVETSLRSNLSNKTKDTFNPIFDITKSIIELKLPSALPKDKIENNNNIEDTIAEWKNFLTKVNK